MNASGNRIWNRRVATALATAGAALLAGCAANTSARRPVVAPAETFASPVARSAVRERSLAMLSDAALGSDPLLQANALEALHPTPTRVEPYARAALMSENLGVRFVAAMTIGQLGLVESAPFVRPLLEDDSQMVRAGAIFALLKTTGDVDPSPLSAMLRDPNPRVRAQAAFVLGELGNPSAAPMLREAAKEMPSKAPLSEVRILRLQIAEALVKLGQMDAVETIRASLFPSRPEDLETAALAVQIIGQVNDRRSVDQLIYLTALKPPDRMPAEVRLGAAASLAQLGQPQGAFIADEYWLNEIPALRAQAAFVFGETGRVENLGKLDAMMNDEVGMVRIAAAAAALKVTERATLAGDLPIGGASQSSAAADRER